MKNQIESTGYLNRLNRCRREGLLDNSASTLPEAKRRPFAQIVARTSANVLQSKRVGTSILFAAPAIAVFKKSLRTIILRPIS
jgi:hypothetical protein